MFCQKGPPLRRGFHLSFDLLTLIEAVRLCSKFCHLRMLLISQLSQTFLQVLQVCIPIFTLATTGAALQELHLQRQLAELKVFAFLPQIHAATN